MKNIRLGDVLIEFGYITPDQLNTALAYQKEHRDLRVGQALQELGYVNERQVLGGTGPAPPAYNDRHRAHQRRCDRR